MYPFEFNLSLELLHSFKSKGPKPAHVLCYNGLRTTFNLRIPATVQTDRFLEQGEMRAYLCTSGGGVRGTHVRQSLAGDIVRLLSKMKSRISGNLIASIVSSSPKLSAIQLALIPALTVQHPLPAA